MVKAAANGLDLYERERTQFAAFFRCDDPH
jgi:hypothetical protein